MALTYDRQITISIGRSRKDVRWTGQQLTLAELYERLKSVTRSTETLVEYLKLPKAQQDDLKDIGGFVGGSLKGIRRKAAAVTGRDLITLDFDSVPAHGIEAIEAGLSALGCGYCIYSTRKHSPARPRLRVVVPTDRAMNVDEYEPVARQVAAFAGITMADPTTFDVGRLMYWPSCCADGEFYYTVKDAPLLGVDFILSSMYSGWHNVSEWPRSTAETPVQRLAATQGEPTEKPGVVGAFCRRFDILQAMDTFLPGLYEPVVGSEDRFTYSGGTTSGGAIVYDHGKFLYSHHATDPCSGRLVNAFDLVRLHKFGDRDDSAVEGTAVNKLPSYHAMLSWISEETSVMDELQEDQYRQALEEFREMVRQQNAATGGAGGGGNATDVVASEPDTDWLKKLEREKNGTIKSTAGNAVLILQNDERVKGAFGFNEFSSMPQVTGPLPWYPQGTRRAWSDTDQAYLYMFLESYGLSNRQRIDSAISIVMDQNKFNDVVDYLSGLTWDGVPRLDKLFVDYLGAADIPYTRAVARKSFTAAVARAMDPGCKYDQMVILCGPQGVGKSMLLDKMSRGWFSDSLRTFEGKEASEMLQGVWIVEVGELDAFRRSDSDRIKQFLSQRSDQYRAAYARNKSVLPRRCVLFGTTNTLDFLHDDTGNRRFWPVDVEVTPHDKHVWDDLTDAVIDQIWAEAVQRWADGEELTLKDELLGAATRAAKEHEEKSDLAGMIEEFLEKPIPVDWREWDYDRRMLWWSGSVVAGTVTQTMQRESACAFEIHRELLGRRPEDFERTQRIISKALKQIDGWHQALVRLYGPYGKKLYRGVQRDKPV